jgi:16S rRNA processing protein RimM
MNNTDPDYIIIGKFSSTFGVHGWIKIRAFTEFGESILKYLPWYIKRKNEPWTPIKVESGRVQGKGILAKLEGINTPEEARLLTGLSIAIPRSQLPSLKDDEYYWSDLVGLTVINKNGELLGKVIYLIETGSNDVLVIKGDKEHAIPYLMGTVITRIDLEKKEIHVDWELQ